MTANDRAPIRVFLIDHHRIVLWGLCRLVESAAGAMQLVGSAVSCAEALDLLGKAAPDLIVLDIDLGTEDGIAEMPKLFAMSTAKILVLTGTRDRSAHDRAVLAGACGIVAKAAAPESLLTAIEKVHEGQIWLDRAATGRIFVEFSRESAAQASDPKRMKIASLTHRERAIIELMTSNPGATAKTVAQLMFISEHTLRNHLTAIYNKLGVANRLELFDFAQKNGLTKQVFSKA